MRHANKAEYATESGRETSMTHTNKTEYATESRRETSTRHANKTEYATRSDRETSVSFESRNPATGELLGTYPAHDKAEIEVRLQRAWDGWPRFWKSGPRPMAA